METFRKQICQIEELQTKLAKMEAAAAASSMTVVEKSEQFAQTDTVVDAAAGVVVDPINYQKLQIQCSEPWTNDVAADEDVLTVPTQMVDKSTDTVAAEAVDRSAQTDAITKSTTEATLSQSLRTTSPPQSNVVKDRIDVNTEENTMMAAGDIAMLTDPNVEREEELVAFKEECSRLLDDNLHMKKEMHEMQSRLAAGAPNMLSNNLMYIAPLFAIIGYFLISPYL